MSTSKPAVKRAQRTYPVLFSAENGEIPALYFMSPSPPPVPPVPVGHAQLPRWSTGHAARAHGLVTAPRALGLMLAPLLLLLGCAALEPHKRTLTVVTPGERATVVLVFPGLHVHAAGELLTGEAAAAAAALGCDTAALSLTSAVEETATGKDGEVIHTTTIGGTAQCSGVKR